jgi:hypothetical protein
MLQVLCTYYVALGEVMVKKDKNSIVRVLR